ncbi:MAG TPA: hypothetical protein VLA49_04610 [Anaerolineales bacterium]|nr:hypothetical protein [Anaerolineales bacterium]
MAVTIGVVLASPLCARIAGHTRPHHLIQRITLVMIGGLLAFRLLLNIQLAKACGCWVAFLFQKT